MLICIITTKASTAIRKHLPDCKQYVYHRADYPQHSDFTKEAICEIMSSVRSIDYDLEGEYDVDMPNWVKTDNMWSLMVDVDAINPESCARGHDGWELVTIIKAC